MRLLLDAHLSGRYVARPLREDGFDVFSVDEDRSLDGAEDAELLTIAADTERVLVTLDVKDFAPMAREWAEAGRTHAGLIIVVGLATNDFGAILEGVVQLRDKHPDPGSWNDRVTFLSR